MQISYFQWHPFIPEAWNNVGVVITIWAPIILVYFVDIQIWYATLSTLLGGIHGAVIRLGEIQTIEMVQSRFESLSDAFNVRLVPASNLRKNGSTEEGATMFSHTWNNVIISFREEDLISDREKYLLLVPPYWPNVDLVVQWPTFLLASKIPIALDMAKDSSYNAIEMKMRITVDTFMYCAVRECYASFRYIINSLVDDQSREKCIINDIFKEVDTFIEADTLTSELKMSALPSLCCHFGKLVKLLLVNEPGDEEEVTIIFQDMLEVVAHDIMEDKIDSLLESNEEPFTKLMGTRHVDQLFASPGAIKFPIHSSEKSWKELISLIGVDIAAKNIYGIQVVSLV